MYNHNHQSTIVVCKPEAVAQLQRVNAENIYRLFLATVKEAQIAPPQNIDQMQGDKAVASSPRPIAGD